jgi:hypothetical protein
MGTPMKLCVSILFVGNRGRIKLINLFIKKQIGGTRERPAFGSFPQPNQNQSRETLAGGSLLRYSRRMG